MVKKQMKQPDHKDDFEKGNEDLLQEALKRTYTERFLFATKLYKIQMTLQKAKITHQPLKGK